MIHSLILPNNIPVIDSVVVKVFLEQVMGEATAAETAISIFHHFNKHAAASHIIK